jgi:hypothetical protein
MPSMSEETTRAGANPADLPAAQNPAETSNPNEGTEDLLNSLIVECREYVRAIAAQFANPETDPLLRWQIMERMMELVKTGASVGETVAKLRGGGASELRQRIIVERSVSVPPGGEGGRLIPENE